MGIKAAGGVSSYEDAEKMVFAGATRIGASAGVKIVQGESGSAPSMATPVAVAGYA
jgi:deoxyribose-phosphate aldolase